MLRSLHEVETRLSSSKTYFLHVKTPEIFKHQFLSAFIFWSGANRQNFHEFQTPWLARPRRSAATRVLDLGDVKGENFKNGHGTSWECSEYLIMLTCTACTFSSFSCTLFHFETVYDSCSLHISKSTNLASLSYPEFPGACFATSYLPCVDSRQWGPGQGNPALQ